MIKMPIVQLNYDWGSMFANCGKPLVLEFAPQCYNCKNRRVWKGQSMCTATRLPVNRWQTCDKWGKR